MNNMPLKKRILLGQLAARGDCLYATTVARQIKHDNPGCHLTWAIGSMCKSILDNNPYIDEIWEIPVSTHSEVASAWDAFEKEAIALKEIGVFDAVFFTQISPNNFQNFDGTVRASIFRGYPHPISVPIAPIVKLTSHEIEHVQNFAETHRLKNYSPVILFECSSHSGQSFVTPQFALEVSQKIINQFHDACIILSSNIPINQSFQNIIDGSTLSFRENLALTKYCTLLIGCSSGISWLCTAEDAYAMPKIQLLKKNRSVFASMVHDHEHFGCLTNNVLEMTDCNSQKIFDCVYSIISNGFTKAKQQFHEQIPLNFDFYFDLMSEMITKKQFRKYIRSMINVINRYGIKPQFVKAFVTTLPKNLKRLCFGK